MAYPCRSLALRRKLAAPSLINAPVLKQPDFSKPFEVIPDASDKGVGAVLLQDSHLIACESGACRLADRVAGKMPANPRAVAERWSTNLCGVCWLCLLGIAVIGKIGGNVRLLPQE